MAKTLKKISKFSNEAINLVIAHCLPGDIERNEFKTHLQEILKKLNTIDKDDDQDQVVRQKPKVSDARYFKEKIMPLIWSKIKDYENLEATGTVIEWNIDFSFIDSIKNAKFDDLNQCKEMHNIILRQENISQQLGLISGFYRGRLYVEIKNKYSDDMSIKKFIREHFNICYETMIRYVCFFLLIQKYPRLLVCNLSCNQIIKHISRIGKLLDEDEELHEKLCKQLHLSVLGVPIDFQPIEQLEVPKLKFNKDLDHVFDDNEADDEPETEEVSRCYNITRAPILPMVQAPILPTMQAPLVPLEHLRLVPMAQAPTTSLSSLTSTKRKLKGHPAVAAKRKK